MPCYKVKRWRKAFLLILLGATVILFCGWYIKDLHCTPSNRKIHVVLLSSWRSGSSLVGQVFNQHPSVFYLMEPAWHVWMKLIYSGAKELRMAVKDLMRSLFHCDFSVTNAYLPERHNVSSLFMWSRSRALCSPPVCSVTPRGHFSNATQCLKMCDRVGLQGVQEACTSYSHVVLKSVQIFELESLYPLLEDPSLDLRIIHLVRDPRAVFRSRELYARDFAYDNAITLERRNVPAAEVQYQVLQETCSSHVRISERALRKPPPFLKGRYKMVRYEDVVRNPLAEIRAMYDFVNLDMTRQLGEWIYKVTHGKGTGTWQDGFDVTSRDAVAVSQAWRTTLPHSKLKRIQQVCEGAMALLGYITVNSDEEQERLDMQPVQTVIMWRGAPLPI